MQNTFIQSLVDDVKGKILQITIRDVISQEFFRLKKKWCSVTGVQHFLGEFFRVIPKAEGHYCRKDSKKIYLSQVVPAMSKLYSIYKAAMCCNG